MPITVGMIEEKEFKTKVRGYDPVEVDEFLDEICDELIALQDEIASLQEQLAQARAQAARPARPESSPAMQQPTTRPQVPTIAKEQEETLRKLLVNAQRVSDETVAEAPVQEPQPTPALPKVEVEEKASKKREAAQITSVRVTKTTRNKLNALIQLGKADNVDNLIDILLDEYIESILVEDEKKTFHLVLDIIQKRDR